MKLRCLSLTVLILLVWSGAVQAGPVMVIPEPSIKIKEPVLEGATVRGEFEVLNQGDEDLVINKVSPG